MNRERKAPSTKHQAPDKRRIPNTTWGMLHATSCLKFGAWNLELAWYLVLGAWCLVRCLVPGAWPGLGAWERVPAQSSTMHGTKDQAPGTHQAPSTRHKAPVSCPRAGSGARSETGTASRRTRTNTRVLLAFTRIARGRTVALQSYGSPAQHRCLTPACLHRVRHPWRLP